MTALDWAQIAKGFAMQAKACLIDNASPTSAAILAGGAEALKGDHVLPEILATWHDHRALAAVSLRVLGALHRLAMEGRAPELAALMPSVGGTADPDRAWPAAEVVLQRERNFVEAYLTRAPQTNEVGRSAMLLGGFLEIAARFDKPLRLLEIGSSAGLNLCWDKYRVRTPFFTWGDPNSKLELTCDWNGPLPDLDARVNVISRTGCDVAPIDIRNDDDRRRMQSYIWTDQLDRHARMRAAVEIAAATPFTLEAEDAAQWVARKLAEPAAGAVTVLFHSIMWQYMEAGTTVAIEAAIRAAGARATPDTPLAWLAMEPVDLKSFPLIRLTTWPGAESRTLGTVHFHGRWARWGEVKVS